MLTTRINLDAGQVVARTLTLAHFLAIFKGLVLVVSFPPPEPSNAVETVGADNCELNAKDAYGIMVNGKPIPADITLTEIKERVKTRLSGCTRVVTRDEMPSFS